MATRRTLSLSAGFLHRFTSVSRCPHLPVVSRISVQKVGILPSYIPSGVRRFAEDASRSDTGDVCPDVPPVYNKWIVVMDFSEKVLDAELESTFVRIAARVLKSSQEEARQKIYKMETKKYTGFHIYACEETAKELAEQSGVFQVLPESN